MRLTTVTHSGPSPTSLAASCTIAERVYLGAGAIVIDHIAVGRQSVIGAGALVLQDLPARVMVVGSPARVVKRDIDGIE